MAKTVISIENINSVLGTTPSLGAVLPIDSMEKQATTSSTEIMEMTSIGGTGNDTLNGGKDSDTFIISTGNDTIEDFSITEGDQLLVHNSMKLTVEQFGNNLLLSNASHSIRTTLKGVDLDELLAHQPDLFG